MLNNNILTSIIGNQKLTELISENDIKKRISEIATHISKNYLISVCCRCCTKTCMKRVLQ